MSNFTTKQMGIELQAVTTRESACAMANVVAKHMFMRTPTQTSLMAIRTFIEQGLPTHLVDSATLDGIMTNLEIQMGRRKASSLSHVTIPPEVLTRHQHEKCDALPILGSSDFSGVIVLWAPMGSGKTRKVGRPFIRHVIENTGTKPLAICHRVSLVTDLASAMEVEHYGQVHANMADDPKIRGLATCLPSITSKAHRCLIDQAEYVFVDEVSQVLRFLSAQNHCRTKDATNQNVYQRLRDLVANAKCVIVADAGCDARTIEFLESCRPNEKFRIIEMHARDEGINAVYHCGPHAAAGVVGDCLTELAAGGRVWIATESARRARNLGAFFTAQGYRVLSVCSDNKGNRKQAAFLAEPEKVSRNYDVIVASPVIGSGLSIEHTETGEWFTLGVFVGGGHKITPADAAQALRRVRYLRRYSLAFLTNATTGKQCSNDIKGALLEAAKLGGAGELDIGFVDLVADITAADHNACADFAAGLVWQLERAKWTLVPNTVSDQKITTSLLAIDQAQEHAHRAALLAAPVIGPDAASRLERAASRTELENTTIEAYHIRRALNVNRLDEATLDFWDNGEALGRLDRFGAWQGITPWFDRIDRSPARRVYWRAMAAAYKELLEGFDPYRTRVTDALAEEILDRMLKRRHLLAHLGMVSRSYGRWFEDKNGIRTELARPKNARQELAALLKRMGLSWHSTRARVSIPPTTTLEGKAEGGYKMGRFYTVTQDSYETMRIWAERRNTKPDTPQVDGIVEQINNTLTLVPEPSVATEPLPLGLFHNKKYYRPARRLPTTQSTLCFRQSGEQSYTSKPARESRRLGLKTGGWTTSPATALRHAVEGHYQSQDTGYFVPVVGQSTLTPVPSHHLRHDADVTLRHTHFPLRPHTIELASLYQKRGLPTAALPCREESPK